MTVTVLEALILIIPSVILGIILTLVFLKSRSKGALRMHIDPDDGLYLFVEFKKDTDPLEVMKMKRVLFEVNPKDVLSQK